MDKAEGLAKLEALQAAARDEAAKVLLMRQRKRELIEDIAVQENASAHAHMVADAWRLKCYREGWKE